MIKQNLLLTLKERGIGLKSGTVDLVPYQSSWADAYEIVKNEILRIAPELILHHVGSTALFDGYAKPIIDILVIYDSEEEFRKRIPEFIKFGFTYKEITFLPGPRHYFGFYDDEGLVDFVHLHALHRGDENIDEMLFFRDQMRSSRKLAAAYSEFKLDLKAQGISRKDYPHAKAEWIRAVLKRDK